MPPRKIAPNPKVSLSPATLSKKRLWYRCFPMNFAKFFGTHFFNRTFFMVVFVCDASENWKIMRKNLGPVFYLFNTRYICTFAVNLPFIGRFASNGNLHSFEVLMPRKKDLEYLLNAKKTEILDLNLQFLLTATTTFRRFLKRYDKWFPRSEHDKEHKFGIV